MHVHTISASFASPDDVQIVTKQFSSVIRKSRLLLQTRPALAWSIFDAVNKAA